MYVTIIFVSSSRSSVSDESQSKSYIIIKQILWVTLTYDIFDDLMTKNRNAYKIMMTHINSLYNQICYESQIHKRKWMPHKINWKMDWAGYCSNILFCQSKYVYSVYGSPVYVSV